MGGTQTFSLSPGYPYTHSAAITVTANGAPDVPRRRHPTFASLTSAQSVAEQTVVAFVPVADRRAPPIRRDNDVHIDGAHHRPSTVMVVASLDDETPWCGRHLE